MGTAEQFAQSATLSAMLCPRGPETVIRTALSDGLWAAKHGCGIPLPLLLDANAILYTQSARLPIFRNKPAQWPAELDSYDRWLLGLHRIVQKSNLACEHNVLPLLVDGWSANQPKLPALGDWIHAYTTLQNKPTVIQDISKLWLAPRSGKPELWREWLPSPPRQIVLKKKWDHAHHPVGKHSLDEDKQRTSPWYWSNYATATALDWLHESFDHPAARMYAEAKDVPLLPDQQQRIERLIRQRRQSGGDYTRDSREEQNPYFGEPPLDVLTKDEEELIRWLVERRHGIAGPPSTQPPPAIYVHLCLINAFAGIHQVVAPPKLQPGEPPQQQASNSQTAASTLQGIAALIVDDWRFALRNLEQVEFFVHRGEPDFAEDTIGGGGERWKNDNRTSSFVPPPAVTVKFFQRRKWTDINLRALVWPNGIGNLDPFAWWCLCVLKDDLPDLGFHAQIPAGGDFQIRWTAKASALPACISHIILLDPTNGADEICWVDRKRSTGDGLALRPERRRQTYASNSDISYHSLRIQALDILLSALESFYY
jgi:hypothetical protein